MIGNESDRHMIGYSIFRSFVTSSIKELHIKAGYALLHAKVHIKARYALQTGESPTRRVILGRHHCFWRDERLSAGGTVCDADAVLSSWAATIAFGPRPVG